MEFRLRFNTCKELNCANTSSGMFVIELEERFSLVTRSKLAHCPLLRARMRQFVKVSFVRAGIAMSGFDVLRTSRLLLVTGRWLRSLLASVHEAAVAFTHTHLTGQELGFVPPSAYTTTNISAVANNVWAMLF
jgi:hypothetical protein